MYFYHPLHPPRYFSSCRSVPASPLKGYPLGKQLLYRPVAVRCDVRELRLAAGLSQEAAAERFELSLRVWQMKEAAKNPAPLSQGKYEFLLLLAGRHPHYALVQNKKK